MDRIAKLERLLRYHRQRVFDANGDLHHRAILRLKRTATFKRLAANNIAAAQQRLGDRLTGMGY